MRKYDLARAAERDLDDIYVCTFRRSWGESHGAKNIRRLEQHVFPWIGQHASSDMKRADIRLRTRNQDQSYRR